MISTHHAYRMSRVHPALPVALLAAAFLAVAVAAENTPRLRIEPDTVKLRLGEGRQLSARISGLKGTPPAVRWSVEGEGLGSISSTGFFQASTYGATPFTVRVVAETEGEPGLRAEASIFIQPVAMDVQPETVALRTGETYSFRARVMGVEDPRVIWSVEGGAENGSISDQGLYTAPAAHATPATVTVKAAAAADPSKFATATVRLEEVEIQARPREVTLQHGVSRRFDAVVKGSANTDVIWQVEGEGLGSITPTGLYTPPAMMTTPALINLLAVAEADPSKQARVQVRIPEIVVSGNGKKGPREKQKRSPLHRVARGIYRIAAPRVVQIIMPFDPVDTLVRGPKFVGKSGKRYVPLGGGTLLEAAVHHTTNPALRWELVGNKFGELSEDGIYRAPEQATTPQVVQVQATSLADPTKKALYTLHIPPIVVEAPREMQSCLLDGAVQLAARVENAENDRLLWSVEGGTAYGSVSENGLYHPPASLTTPAVVRVRAASFADPTKFAVVQVRIPEVRVELSPESAEVRPGRSVRLKVRVVGCAARDSQVSWKLTPEMGSISPDGLYQAPEAGAPAEVQVTAILKADPTKTATALLRLRP